jgi:hypothetical protein
MTTDQKIIRAKVGLLELAKQLGNVSQGCKACPGEGVRASGGKCESQDSLLVRTVIP